MIRKLADELQPPDSGRKSIVLVDDADTKVIQLEFTVGGNTTFVARVFIKLDARTRRE